MLTIRIPGTLRSASSNSVWLWNQSLLTSFFLEIPKVNKKFRDIKRLNKVGLLIIQMLNKAPKMYQTRNYSEIYSCVCANVLLNKMKLNIEDSVTKIMEFKFKTKKCLLMTPATFECEKD